MSKKHYTFDFLRTYYGDDDAAMATILKLYLEETPKELDEIEKFLANNNAEGAKQVTHKIKTNVAMLGINDRSEFISAMHEQAADEEVHEKIIARFKTFKKEVLQGLKEIEKDFFSEG